MQWTCFWRFFDVDRAIIAGAKIGAHMHVEVLFRKLIKPMRKLKERPDKFWLFLQLFFRLVAIVIDVFLIEIGDHTYCRQLRKDWYDPKEKDEDAKDSDPCRVALPFACDTKTKNGEHHTKEAEEDNEHLQTDAHILDSFVCFIEPIYVRKLQPSRYHHHAPKAKDAAENFEAPLVAHQVLIAPLHEIDAATGAYHLC